MKIEQRKTFMIELEEEELIAIGVVLGRTSHTDRITMGLRESSSEFIGVFYGEIEKICNAIEIEKAKKQEE